MNRKFVIISIAIALLIVAIITGSSYAYFSALNQTGNEEVITSGNMALTLTDGTRIETGSMLPGDYVEKVFSVENTGNVASSYDIYLSEVINNFVDQTDLVYEIISLDGGYNTVSPVQVPNVSTKIVNNQSIGVGITHHYKLKITFLSKNENQDDNQGKLFSAKIQVNEYQDIETTINYYLDNVLVSTLPNQASTNYVNSTCDKGGSVLFDTNAWTYTTNILQNGTTCSINFATKQYVLTFDYNYEGSTPIERTLNIGSEYGELPSASRTGYDFLGWFTDPTNGTQVSATDTISNTTTVYAHWAEKTTLADYITNLEPTDSTIEKDTTTDQNVRYVGTTNVNNYVTFNNEKWRIIGVFGDNVKIIKTTRYGNATYKFNNRSGELNWDQASIKDLLNDTYFNSLSATTRAMIQSHTFNIGSVDISKDSVTCYNREKTTISSSCNIGLMNPSDYGFSAPKANWNQALSDINNTGSSNWITEFIGTAVPTMNKSSSSSVQIVQTDSRKRLAYGYDGNFNQYPVLYLKSTVKVTANETANGTSTYPYQIFI